MSTPSSKISDQSVEPLFSPEQLRKLRQALTRDLGRAEDWSDDEIRRMASDTLHAITVLRRASAAQRQRRQ